MVWCGLGGQSMALADDSRQPGDTLLRSDPADVDNRSMALAPTLVGRAMAAVVVVHTGLPLIEADLAARLGEASDADVALRSLIDLSLRLLRGAPHREAAGRDHHHFGALRTVPKAAAGAECGQRRAASRLMSAHRASGRSGRGVRNAG